MSRWRLVNYLERPDAVKWQVWTFAIVIDRLEPMECDYKLMRVDTRLIPEVNTDKIRPARRKQTFPKFDWPQIPHRPLAFRVFRSLANIWMVYIVIRYFLSQQIASLLDTIVELDRPINCYLIGRFILHEGLAEVTAVLFSSLFLIAHFILLFSTKPIHLNLAYFLVLDHNDKKFVYEKLKRSGSIEFRLDQLNQLEPCERFLLDTMCYRVLFDRRARFRLRANRTPEAYAKICHQAARLTISVLSLLSMASVALASVNMALHLLDWSYVRVYPNCDPQLERQEAEGRLGQWSITMTGHHTLTTLADILENTLIWVECGFVAVVAPAGAYVFNYDLSLLWSGIKRHLELMGAHLRTTDNERRHSRSSDDSSLKLATYELVAEISDFFKQVDKLGQVLSLFLDFTVIGCLTLCALYTWFLRSRSFQQVPIQLMGLLATFAAGITFGCFSFVKLHHLCTSSYITLCSVMAHDRRHRESINYALLLDFYLKRRDCTLILSQFRFMPTTFMTLIGWTFSCFCIITQIMKQRRVSAD